MVRDKSEEILANEKSFDVVCSDLNQAFDRVPQDRLLLMLENILIVRPLLK